MHLIQEDVLALLLCLRVQHLLLSASQNLDLFFFFPPAYYSNRRTMCFVVYRRGVRDWGDNRGVGAHSERMSLCLGSQHGYVIHASRAVFFFLSGP